MWVTRRNCDARTFEISDGLEREAECNYAVTWFRGNPILCDVSLDATYCTGGAEEVSALPWYTPVSIPSKCFAAISKIYRSSLLTLRFIKRYFIRSINCYFTSLAQQVLPSLSRGTQKLRFPLGSPSKLMYKVFAVFFIAHFSRRVFAIRKQKRRDGCRWIRIA